MPNLEIKANKPLLQARLRGATLTAVSGISVNSGIPGSLTMPSTSTLSGNSSSGTSSSGSPSSSNTGTTTGSLSTGTVSTEAVNVILNGLFLNHHFDGGTRGSTGEFYFYTVVSDGVEMIIHTSKSAGMGGADGIQQNVASGTWLAVEDLNIFNIVGRENRATSINVGVRVIETDNSDKVQAVFTELAKVGGTVASAIAGIPAIAPAGSKAVNAVNALIELDGDDLALGRVEGLHYYENYRVGKFIVFTGAHNTKAVMSVIPTNKTAQDFLFREDTVTAGVNTSAQFRVSKLGQVAYFLQQHGIGITVELVNADTGTTVKRWRTATNRYSAFGIKTFHDVAPGNYYLKVTQPLFYPGKIKYMYTAYGSVSEGLALRP